MRSKSAFLWTALCGVVLGVGLSVLGSLLWAKFHANMTTSVQQVVHDELAASRSAQMKILKKNIQVSVREELRKDAFDLTRQRKRHASLQSAKFVDQHMSKTQTFRDAFALLEHSLRTVPSGKKGLYCEFGVYKGTTINFIASKVQHTIHGFDSFEGLPETWRTGFEKGTFQLSNLPKVRQNVKLHKGWFDKSLPKWADKHSGPVVFIHLDADLYSSTKTVLDILGNRIVVGTVLQFDEYFNYPGWKHGEHKAFAEFVKQHNVQFKYIGYTTGGNAQQAAVQITSIGQRYKALSQTQR